MKSRYYRFFLLINIGILIFIVNCGSVTVKKFNTSIFNNYVMVNPLKIWRFLDKNGDEIINRFYENIDGLTIGRIKCLRYYIEDSKLTNDAPLILHLIWNLRKKQKFDIGSTSIFDKKFSEIVQGKLSKSNNSQNPQNECMFSIVIGCEIPQGLKDNLNEIEKKFINSWQFNFDILKDSDDSGCSLPKCINEKLIDRINLMNETEINFRTQRHQIEINAIVFGNISDIDLKMPIVSEGSSFTVPTPQKEPRLILTTMYMPGGISGLRLNVLNPPQGVWRFRLFGVSNENYRFIVTSSTTDPEFYKLGSLDYFLTYGKTASALKTYELQNKHNNSSVFSHQIKIIDNEINRIQISNNTKVNHELSVRRSDAYLYNEQNKHISSHDNTMDINNNVSMQTDTFVTKFRMIDRESLELDDFSRSINDELPIKKHLIVDINPNSNLIANPGTQHLVTFDITNNHILTIRHYFTPRSSPFRAVATIPPYRFVDIAPSQTISVAVVIQIPTSIMDFVLNTVTLHVQGIENLEKSAELRVRTSGSRLLDDIRPTIYYYYNNNCAGRNNAEKCLKSYWSVDITIQDSDSGLKSVISIPKGIYPRYPYISGTSSPIHFYYSNNCCNRVVEITATDINGNIFSKKVDVQEWNNLMEGEIAAIVVGIMFIIVLIILITILFLFCSHKKKSHNLTYCQRYGSRSAPRSE